MKEDNKHKDLLFLFVDENEKLRKEYVVLVACLSVAIAYNILLKLFKK